MIEIQDLDSSNLPNHIAIIMDGNGRWAKKEGKPRLFGHAEGVNSVRDIVETARRVGIKTLTLYAFSSENWKRPQSEVSGLMALLETFLETELSNMLENNIRFTCIGEISRLPENVRLVIDKSITTTARNTGTILNLALSYGSRDEIVRAVKNICSKVSNGEMKVDAINDETICQHLYTNELVDPDLIIRTGGEARLSNFLLWQASYSEIYFSDIMWPDFREKDFLTAILNYQKRDRRFGTISNLPLEDNE